MNRDYEQFLSMDTLRKKELYLESVIITANSLLELYKDLQNEKEPGRMILNLGRSLWQRLNIEL